MIGRIKYLTKQDIELKAHQLRFSSYPKRKVFQRIEPEQIIYKNFPQDELRLELESLPTGLLGKCTVLDDGRGIVIIDEKHYQNDDESKVDFSIGHELGHFVFHRDYLGQEVYKTVANGLPKFDDAQSAQNYKQLEWQADYFAGALQMPLSDMSNFHEMALSKLPYLGRHDRAYDKKQVYLELGIETTNDLISEVANSMKVSPIAFSIRLRYLDILNLDGYSFYRRNRTTGLFEYGF